MSQEFKKQGRLGNIAIPEPIRQVKDNTINVLLNQLGDMFASCDDLFFDLSGRANSNSEQNLYFESMREVRLKKGGLTASFKRETDSQYHELSSPYAQHKIQQEPELTASSLSLIENDQLEQKVAISSMVTKAKALCQEELYHLNCRFDYLIDYKLVNEKNNPLDPEQICTAFARAAEILDLNIKARIILLKQFDRFIISRLPKIYQQANQLLINADVLPKITATIKKQADTDVKQGHTAEVEAGNEITQGGTEGVIGLTELRTLLNSLRSSSATTPSIVALVPGYSPSSPKMRRDELLSLLSHIQQQHLLTQANADEISNAPDIRAAIKQILLNGQEQGAPKSIQQPDEDIINLVAMFFDFVLDDRNIPIPVQALLARVQIPVLKIALKDKAFFNNNNHPARCLINEIANASIGWSETDKHAQDHLLEKISAIIQTVHDKYADNSNIFEEQLTELRTYLKQENRKASLIEKRVSEAAVGKAKTDHARDLIQHLLDERLQGKKLPKIVPDFLNQQWKQVLLLTQLREGEKSAKWLAAIQTMDDLVWCSQTHNDQKSSERLKHLLPSLYERLQQALQLVSASPADTKALLTELQSAHQKIINNRLSEIEFNIQAATDSASQNIKKEKAWQEMSAVERQQAKHRKLEYAFIKAAEKMPIGTWLEFSNSNAQGPSRCKLTAKVDVSDSYIFVNRFGSQVMEKDRKQFAYELQRKKIKVLDKGPIFDRTVSRISKNLRQLKTAAH